MQASFFHTQLLARGGSTSHHTLKNADQDLAEIRLNLRAPLNSCAHDRPQPDHRVRVGRAQESTQACYRRS